MATISSNLFKCSIVCMEINQKPCHGTVESVLVRSAAVDDSIVHVQIDDAAAAQERLKRQLKAKDTALDRKQHELEDSQSALVRDQERWEGLAAQQQKALDTLKGERDEAVAESRGLRDEVCCRAVP